MKEAINATIQRILRTDRGITANQVLVTTWVLTRSSCSS